MRRIRTVPALAFVLLPLAATAYQTQNNYWKVEDGPVEYYVSPVGSDDMLDTLDETTAIDNAFHTWECALCSTIQFRNMGIGDNELAQDGKNTVMWMENASRIQQLIGANPDGFLAATINFDPQAIPFFEQDTIFNGTTFQGDRIVWSTDPHIAPPDAGYIELDIETVMLREVGFFLGLKDNCDASGNNCAGLAVSVMTPSYGGIQRALRDDDILGVCSIYPGQKVACEGYRRLRESCERDCDCEPELKCVPDGEGRMCSRTCDAETGVCPNKTGCVLKPAEGGSTGTGLCLRRTEANQKIDGMVCNRDSECESLTCARVAAIGKQVCTRGCSSPEQCRPGYDCLGNNCLLPSAGDTVPCEAPATDAGVAVDAGSGGGPPGCSETGAPDDGMPGAMMLLLAAGVVGRKRRGFTQA